MINKFCVKIYFENKNNIYINIYAYKKLYVRIIFFYPVKNIFIPTQYRTKTISSLFLLVIQITMHL